MGGLSAPGTTIEITRLVKDRGRLTKRIHLADGTIVNVPANAKIRAINTKTRAKSAQRNPRRGRSARANF